MPDKEQERCTLYVDDRFPADRRSERAFLDSGIPGVVVPAETSFDTPRLVCGDTAVHGNKRIQEFVFEHRR